MRWFPQFYTNKVCLFKKVELHPHKNSNFFNKTKKLSKNIGIRKQYINMIYNTRIDGFPVANISVHVIAPAREITTSEAAYAISSSCKNLHKKENLKLSESVNQPRRKWHWHAWESFMIMECQAIQIERNCISNWTNWMNQVEL